MIGRSTRTAQKRSLQVARQPAPIRGIDGRIAMSSNNPDVCIYTYNLMPSEYGMKLRKGYQEWQTGLGAPVNTIIPFEGKNRGNSDDKLFAVTKNGIYDVTGQGQTPIKKTSTADWPLTTETVGWGVHTQFTTDAGEQLLFYADNFNGLYVYSQQTDQWTRPTGLTGIVVENINFVMVHKNRLFFGVESDGKAYYLPPRAIAGAVSDFNVAVKFKHGGSLLGMYNWTVDGGQGVDDYLVFISTAGDVLPYQGSNIDSATDWGLVGTYYVGSMPNGSRCVQQTGGNMNLLSVYGLTSMSDLLRGVDPKLPNEQSIGSRVTEFLRDDMKLYRTSFGWDIKTIPSEGSIAVLAPIRLNGTYIQYVYNTAVDGWGIWRGLPLRCGDVWNDALIFGSEKGIVYTMNVDKDNVKINPETPQDNGEAIDFSILFNYHDLGVAGVFKQGVMIRPDFSASQRPSYDSKFYYDYEVTERVLSQRGINESNDLWDSSNWDFAVWSTATLNNYNSVIGGTGRGRYVSIALRGAGVGDMNLRSTDIMYELNDVL